MAEGGQFPWKVQRIDASRGPPVTYGHISRGEPLPAPPVGTTWVRDEETREWNLARRSPDSRLLARRSPCSTVPSPPTPASVRRADVRFPRGCSRVPQRQKPGARPPPPLPPHPSSPPLPSPPPTVPPSPPRRSSSASGEDAVEGVDYVVHAVLSTDTLPGLCLRYKVSAVQLRRANNFSGTSISRSRLIIPLKKDGLRGLRVKVRDKQPSAVAAKASIPPALCGGVERVAHRQKPGACPPPPPPRRRPPSPPRSSRAEEFGSAWNGPKPGGARPPPPPPAVPSRLSSSAPRKDAVEGVDYVVHTVLPSDTFSGLCLRYKISPVELRRANKFSGTNLRLAPSRLVIPLSEDGLQGGRIRVQDKESPEYKIHEVMAAVPGLGSSSEARAYLLMSGWDVAGAIDAAREDLGWERENANMAGSRSDVVGSRHGAGGTVGRSANGEAAGTTWKDEPEVVPKTGRGEFELATLRVYTAVPADPCTVASAGVEEMGPMTPLLRRELELPRVDWLRVEGG